MPVKEEDRKIDAERTLFPVLDVVCKNLCAKDLLSTARVCKSWNFMVSREKRKRCEIQRFRLSQKMKNLAAKLDVVPSASILFYTTELEYSLMLPLLSFGSESGVNLDILKQFQSQLPNETVVLKSDEVVDSELTGTNEMLGLFFPTAEGRIHVHVATCDSQQTEMNTADYLAAKLGMTECPHPKSTLILFYSYGIRDCRHFTKLCRREEERGKEITLASMCGTSLITSQSKSSLATGSTVALRISGANVESHSTYLHHLAREAEIEGKFQHMKEKLKLKRFNIGLIYTRKCVTPNCRHETHPVGDAGAMMQRLKRFFPDVRFTGFFKHCEYYYPPLMEIYDRFDERFVFDEDFLCNLSYYASIVIISYD